MKRLQSIQDVTNYQVEQDRRLYSANHDEILAGLTTDVYFVKTKQILESFGYRDSQVTAEIFPGATGSSPAWRRLEPA